MKYPNFNINNKPKKNPKLVYTLYLTQSSGELASSEVCCSGCGQRNPITELIQSHVFLYILSELNSADKQKPNNSKNQSKPKNPTKKESKKKNKRGWYWKSEWKPVAGLATSGDELVRVEDHDLVFVGLVNQYAVNCRGIGYHYGEPIAYQSEHALHDLSFRFSLLIFLCVGGLRTFDLILRSKTLNKYQRFSALRKKLRDFCFCFVFLKQGLGLYGLRNGPIWCGDFFSLGLNSIIDFEMYSKVLLFMAYVSMICEVYDPVC